MTENRVELFAVVGLILISMGFCYMSQNQVFTNVLNLLVGALIRHMVGEVKNGKSQ